MNDVDNILASVGISSNSSSENIEAPQETTEEFFSDEDIDNILQDNNYASAFSESNEEPLENEQSEESLVEELNEELDDLLEENERREDREEEAPLAPVEEEQHPTSIENPTEENIQEEESNEEGTSNESSDETLIPLNSPTLLMEESTTRFSGAEWFSEIQKARIIIGGCGGISSNLAFQLARMVPASITLYDDDMVEMVNMAGQLFSLNDLGKSKVDAMADMITNYTTMRQVNAVRERFTSATEPGDIMLCGFDNMTARYTFFNSWEKYIAGKTKEEKAKCLFMDGRLSMTELQILCIRGDDEYNIKRYKKEFLFSDSEAEATICSMKQTTYLACMIGSLMTNLFTNFIASQLNPIIPYDLPFFTEYDAQNMLFITES